MADTDATRQSSGVNTVKVSLLHAVGYRESKDAEITKYRRGIVEMPLEHARALGLTHRIQGDKPAGKRGQGGQGDFEGAFDPRLTGTLLQAGYKNLGDLSKASQSELMALEGVGPAAFERIMNAVMQGRGAE